MIRKVLLVLCILFLTEEIILYYFQRSSFIYFPYQHPQCQWYCHYFKAWQFTWFMKNIPIIRMKNNRNSKKKNDSICQYVWVPSCDKHFKEIKVVWFRRAICCCLCVIKRPWLGRRSNASIIFHMTSCPSTS